ncbi:MBL fold metallo-hydrolase [Alicyclobacillus kakegawensis]|uniref:MBL fold metallo-hydrolase n=1 Tax=Alicyclobacillus kakegawensis TaxID=392012 RepID=UPI0008368B7A|nr:MBL fold metallo-hydrolase [Alicyclobacillus kakegawensis]
MESPAYLVDMGHDVWQIDLLEQGLRARTGAYVILDEQVTVVETGAANCQERLWQGLQELGVKPEQVAYVIVTHVHLDHAGGAGQMMAKAVNAKLVVHPRGARHMAEPSRLWRGASEVYGSNVERLFGRPEAVPEERIIIREHGDTLNIGRRTLTFFDSPGHAKHHFTILDPVSDALFAGDAVGIRYRRSFTGWDFEWVMPSTSPVDFDPEAVHNTMKMLRDVPFQWVYHTHFGRSPKEEAIAGTLRGAQAMADLIDRLYYPGITLEPVMEALRAWVQDGLAERGYNVGDVRVLDIDIILDAMGLLVYAEKRRRGRESK